MDLVWAVLTFCLGIGLLVKGADWLVDSAARIAKQFGVSNFVIGLTIVAMGTTLPEFGTAVIASLHKDSGLVLGVIVGSNIANIALVLGMAGLFVPIGLKRNIYNRDGLVMLSAAAIFYLFVIDGVISLVEGLALLLLFLFYILPLFPSKRRYRADLHFRKYLREYAVLKKRQSFEHVPSITESIRHVLHEHILQKILAVMRDVSGLWERTLESVRRNIKRASARKEAFGFLFKQLGFLVAGVACIFFGANFVVTSAASFPINQIVVGLVFVAVGTSLPELSVAITSLRKGIPEIMIGNLMGSNITNILWIVGISALMNPVRVPLAVITMDCVFMLLITWLFLVFLRNDRKITSIESATLLLIYVAFLIMIFVGKPGPAFVF